MSSRKTETYRTSSSEETKKLGYNVARALTGGQRTATTFALQGDLGAGKTTFVQGFLKGLGSKKRVTSPTFVLMRRHALAGGSGASVAQKEKKFKNVFHIDAYRLKKPEHMTALKLSVILNEPGNIILIEWPEQAKEFLPRNTTWVMFEHGKEENQRIITIKR